MNYRSTKSKMSSTIVPGNATVTANTAASAMVQNESTNKYQKRQREEPHLENMAQESHYHDHVNDERPCPHLVQQDNGNIHESSTFECDSSSERYFQLMRNKKLQSLQAEAGVLHSDIGTALHRYIVAKQENNGSSSEAGDSAESFLETCLNHYKQAVKFHTLALSTLSRDASLEEMQQTQDHVNEMHAKLSWVRSALAPSSVSFSNSKSSSAPSANGKNLHYFAEILSMDCYSQSKGISQQLFIALFNMSTLYYTHYIQQKGQGSDDGVKANFANEERVNQVRTEDYTQMSYLLLSKALSLLQSIDEKRKISDACDGNISASENSEYAMMIQNNMAVLLSDVYGRHDEALESLEDVVFWILGEGEEVEQIHDDDSGNDDANTFSSTDENDNFLCHGESDSSDTDIGFSVGGSCRRVSVGDDDSFNSLAPTARLHSRHTSSLRRERKAVLLFNSSRIHYRCGLFQDAAELYRQYSMFKFPVISFLSSYTHSDFCASVEGHDCTVAVDDATSIENFGEMLDVILCSRVTGGEEIASGCIAAAAA